MSQMVKSDFGLLPDGSRAALYTLTNDAGASVSLSDFGARLVSCRVPGRDGTIRDVVLGFDCSADYLERGKYFGASCGRYANRLRGARFSLNGETCPLAANNGANALHGGLCGFNAKLWEARETECGVQFRYVSPDGEEGYPGTLDTTVTYRFTAQNELEISYRAVCDRDTILNLTNHAFFNLAGHDAGDVCGQLLELGAEFYTPVDDQVVPTGEILSVRGTPFDFLTPKPIGRDLASGHRQLLFAHDGYDHNFVLKKAERGALSLAASVTDPASGRRMRVFTTEPGIQFYSGNTFRDVLGRGGAVYGQYAGFALETQHFPNAMELTHFPTPVLRAGEEYTQRTIYQFSVDGEA